MPFNNSQRGVLTKVIPDENEPADFPPQITTIINAIEPKLILTATTTANADALLAPIVDGMVLITTTVPEFYVRIGGAWRKVWPISYTGTAAPAAGTGINGDVYFQTA